MLRINHITPKYVETIPAREELEEGILYISLKFGKAIHLCCCGCGWENDTPFGTKGWKLTVEDAGVVSLDPALVRGFPCLSYYFIVYNQVSWVQLDTDTEPAFETSQMDKQEKEIKNLKAANENLAKEYAALVNKMGTTGDNIIYLLEQWSAYNERDLVSHLRQIGERCLRVREDYNE